MNSARSTAEQAALPAMNIDERQRVASHRRPVAFAMPAAGVAAAVAARGAPRRNGARRADHHHHHAVGAPVRRHATTRMRFRDDGTDAPPPAAAAAPAAANDAATTFVRGGFRIDPALAQTDPEENLRGFVKTRGSLDPAEEFVFWFAGTIYGHMDDEKHCRLFDFEGYNIGRFVRVHGGWRLLTREVGLYRDPATHEILAQTWRNPYTGLDNDVVHTWNDPVNQEFLLSPGKLAFPTTLVGNDMFWHAEIPICYPSPIPASEFPSNARSDTYRSLEMFQFFSKTDDLESDLPAAVDCQFSWVRVGPWLPWMDMGGLPGSMIYHCRGKRLAAGFADLPPSMREFVEKHNPEYAHAPTDYTKPNETSWTYFKKLISRKGAPRADGTVAIPEFSHTTVVAGHASSDNILPHVKEAVRGPETPISQIEIAQYNGTDPSKPLYLSLGGFVFDVTSAKRHYRRGETYNCLTGRDATCAFLSGDLSEEGLASPAPHAGGEMTQEQQSSLDRWIEFFKDSYPQVGRLVIK